MSGGVDSSVSAALLTEAGVECIGVNMKLYNNEQIGLSCRKTCCSLSDVEDARAVAFQLGMRFYVFNFSDDFEKQVIDRFIKTYETGGTPNPCIDCNRYMKFDKLYRRAQLMECDKVVTGHYARVEKSGERYLLKKAKNIEKDQSYVLYFLNQDQLAHTLLPLGEFESKDQVRAVAEKYGFVNAHKPDSQDICFVPDGDYAAFIEKHTGHRYPDGDFVRPDGEVLGRHKGIIHYTVGQRRGLGLAVPEPVYVMRKDVAQNKVVVGTRSQMLCDGLTAGALNWIAFDAPTSPFRAMIKTRYQAPEVPGTVSPQVDGTVSVRFDQPQKRPAAGQSVVFYQDDVVLGGGTIL